MSPRAPLAGPAALARDAVLRVAQTDRPMALLLGCLLASADEHGTAALNAVAIAFRDHHLRMVRAEGRDAERESGRLSLDEVRGYLTTSLLPRLAREGLIEELSHEAAASPNAPITMPPAIWRQIAPDRESLTRACLTTGERPSGPVAAAPDAAEKRMAAGTAGNSLLEAKGLVKMYRKRKVVNDVALRLQQGEIVGLLGPNGAGKTTTFYMIVGLIPPLAGRILLDGEDITEMPMYRRARRGVGYLSQEPSVFRKLSVQDNILAILETMPLSAEERHSRLEYLLDELSIKHLRESKAYALSGRRAPSPGDHPRPRHPAEIHDAR